MPGAPFLAFFARSGMQCDKNDYRGILAGLEGVRQESRPTPKP